MKKSRKIFIIIAIFIAILLIGRFSLPVLGNFLVVQEEPQHSDIAVLLMGSGPDRMLGAAELFEAGYVDEIVMVRNLVRGYDLALNQGIEIPHDTDIAREVAVQLGVPGDRVTILPGDALSTKDEALAVREYLEGKQDIESLIIVTSKYHSRRAKAIFARAMRFMDRGVRVLSCPSGYDDFNAGCWWKDREDLKRGALEYVKLCYFYLWEQFNL